MPKKMTAVSEMAARKTVSLQKDVFVAGERFFKANDRVEVVEDRGKFGVLVKHPNRNSPPFNPVCKTQTIPVFEHELKVTSRAKS